MTGPFAVIEHAYDEYGVLFFRDQRITPEQQGHLHRRFGQIEFNIFGERWSVPGRPEIVGSAQHHRQRNGVDFGIRTRGRELAQ